jgi:hypothetical protein
MNFKIPIYETNVIVELWDNSEILNKRYKEILQKAKLIDDKEGLAEALVLFSPLGKNELYLLISKKDLDYALIAHECIHIVTEVFHFNNIKLDMYEDDEHYALLMGFVFEKIHSYLIKNNIKIK